MSVCRGCVSVSIVLVTGLAQEAMRRKKKPRRFRRGFFTHERKLIHMLSELVVDPGRDHVEVAVQGYGIADKHRSEADIGHIT